MKRDKNLIEEERHVLQPVKYEITTDMHEDRQPHIDGENNQHLFTIYTHRVPEK